MDAGVFQEISLILVAAAVVSIFMRLLRQPLMIGYILTGILVGPAAFNIIKSAETTELFSHIGIALLLFIIGLGLNPKVIKEVGKVAFVTGIGQIVFTTGIGFMILRLMDMSVVVSLYVSVALAFSSTIIILKLLADKKELLKLHGKIATGFLLVQDLVAVLILIVVSTLNSDSSLSIKDLAISTTIKGAVFIFVIYLISAHILPKLSGFFAKSQEFLFVFSLGWGLGIASLCAALGFSIEIGALAAGVSLAGLPYSFEISSRMRPLRDFFIILFFIVLGMNLSFNSLSAAILPAVGLSLFVLIGNPIIVMALMGRIGYTKNTSFKAGLAVAQISEFSLLLIILGQRVGQINEHVAAIVTLVAIITITVSTYMILYSDQLYKVFARQLGIFERKKLKNEHGGGYHYDCILFGYRGGSHNFIESFKKVSRRYIVIDYDPETIDWLTSRGIPCRYGDASDGEFLDELNLDKVKLAIVNVTDHETNNLVVKHIHYQNQKAVIIASIRSDKNEDALELYEAGASYVMMPHHVSSERVSKLLDRHGIERAKFTQLKEKHTHSLLHEGV